MIRLGGAHSGQEKNHTTTRPTGNSLTARVSIVVRQAKCDVGLLEIPSSDIGSNQDWWKLSGLAFPIDCSLILFRSSLLCAYQSPHTPILRQKHFRVWLRGSSSKWKVGVLLVPLVVSPTIILTMLVRRSKCRGSSAIVR